MSFGWAPSEQLRSRNGGQGLDFFSRLEADQKSRERSVEPPQGILRRKDIPRLHDVILRELNRTKHAPPQPTENLDTILHGDIDVILSIRQEVCRLLQSEVGAKRRKKERAKSHSPLCSRQPAYQKIIRCLILEAASYREEIISCKTPQQFYENLKITFLDIRKKVSQKSASTGLICSVFLLTWIDFLRADFHAFNHHFEGLISLLRSYHKLLSDKAWPPIVNYVARISCMSDACMGFFGDKLRFPSELLSLDHTWLEAYLLPHEIPRVLIQFTCNEYLRTISNFRHWASTQRATAGFGDPFVEEAIARQGDAMTSDIIAWADRTIPRPIETPATLPFSNLMTIEGNDGYTSYFETQPALYCLSEQFLSFPRLQFQDRAHTEMTLTSLGLLLLVSYSTYPQSGHVPFSRWELAVKFCQCYAAYPDKHEIGVINRIFHLFYARLTFDESFPQERAWCDYQWAQAKAGLQREAEDVVGCFTTFMEREWGLA